MRITQGAFSYLPDLTDAEIAAQLAYALGRGFSVAVEHTGDPGPRNIFWEMYGMPMFDLDDPEHALSKVLACRAENPADHIRVTAYDSRLGRQSTALSFIVHRGRA
ncbi:ribulose bisphosphate carboxylase small subunit [Planomonospora sp. ID67723]|uniref:ribulose bisphosphate carboxylase small subunit n=1 Tax=Planomonospora sp. ID67723 TaxID=2738134 RepID=UPI0018C4446A|nr:ribulose bisphosphate carboxylase small subunit [Planomonospora sp. ID67723]MBG0832435.1 ribulose bisphosphate carboxylase small subunit [Planomonospora sp. ID67723]